MLPARVKDFPDTHEEQLLQYIINCNAEFKVAPAYTFYLCALRRLATNENNLVQFLEKVALSINRKTKNITYVVEYAFWLANASELLHFLKYDKYLLNHSQSAQNILTTTIQYIFYRLLTHYMHKFEAATRDRSCLDKVICNIKATTTTLEECWVNVAFTNQLLSFLLQWMCRNLISNIEDPSSYYEYFKQLKYLAKSVDDQHLLEKVMEFDCLIENADQNGQETNAVNCIRLNWRPPKFLECPAGEYNTFLENSLARLLTQIKSEKIQLKENSFALRLLIPYHGYSCDGIKNIPDWLYRFLNPIHQNGWCTFQKQSHSLGNWNVHMEEPKVEYCYLEKVKFYIPQHIKHRKARGVHVTSHTLATSNLVVGDVILSINDKTLIGITQQEAETIVRRSLDIVKVEVMKMNSCEVFLKDPSNTPLPTSHPPPNKTTPEQDNNLEQTVTFNLVENNTLRTKENVSQNVQPEQKQFFVNIRKEIDQLDYMLENFSGISENDRNYEYMKEIMMRNIIKLDNMDTGGNQEVKEMRRDTIYFIQDRMEQLKIKLKENQEKAKPPSDDSNANYKKNESDDVNSSIKSDVPRENVASHEAIPKTINLAETPVAESGNSTKKLTTGSTAGTSNNQQIQNDLQLVYESKFSLNKYATKSISTGILPTSKQNMPVVKISVGSTHIVLRVEDWHSLIKFECLLHQYFNSQSILQTKEEYNKFPTKVFGNYTLCFLTPTKSQKFVGIKCNNDYIYLEQESVEKLLQLRVLISFRLEAIERTCFDDWLQWITAAAVQFSGDPLSNIQNLISNEANNIGPLISSLILEYIHLYPEITKNNVETKRRLFAKQQKTDQK